MSAVTRQQHQEQQVPTASQEAEHLVLALSNAEVARDLGLDAGPMEDAQAMDLALSILGDLLPGMDVTEVVLGGGGFDAEAIADGGTPVEMRESDFAGAARELFPTLDAGGDGHVSAEDIDAAMKDPNLTPSQAAALATMKKYREELEELADDEFGDEDDGISMQDLLHYQATGEVDEELARKIEGRYARSHARVRGASDELFASEIPDVEAIRQGAIGDCWFLAAVGSVAAQRPDDIVDMIADHGDGTYTVTFPNGQSATVDAPTPGEIAFYATSGADGTWLTVLEKAYGKIENDAATVSDDHDQDALDRGRHCDAGTDVFSEAGSSDQDMLSATSLEDTRSKLEKAFAEGRAVTAGVRMDLPGEDSRREGLPMGHCYSVTDYDPATGMVTLRNPWGHAEHGDDGHDDGVFTVSVEEFDRLYSTVAYAD